MVDSVLGAYGASGGGTLSFGQTSSASSFSSSASSASASGSAGGMSSNALSVAAFATGMMADIAKTWNSVHQMKNNYRAAEENYELQLLNQEDERNAMEKNIALSRKNFEIAQASNKAEQIATSGLKSSDFMDVNRAENVKFENDIKAMRDQIRDAFHKQNMQTISNIKKQKRAYAKARGKAILSTSLSLIGAGAGYAYGGAAGAMIGSGTGQAVGSYGG